jgi:hypothetical protein
MTEFRYLPGTVYILENSEVQRVKVGMTINNAADRLSDVNDMWLERKVTCQICAGRLLNRGGLVPQHVKSGIRCPGGNALPIERDVTLAESHLANVKSSLNELSSSEKGSATRIANNLRRRIERYRQYSRPMGKWQVRVTFYTRCAEQVELLTHEILEKHLDKQAPFGEVFYCSVSAASEAVESVLNQLGLSARKETQFPGHDLVHADSGKRFT